LPLKLYTSKSYNFFMRKLLYSLTLTICSYLPIVAQDTLVVHTVKLTNDNGHYKMDDLTITADAFQKLLAEQQYFEAKSKNRVTWVRRLDKNNKMIEQGLFCDGLNAVGNVIRYNEKGQVKYKKIYTSAAVTTCNQSEVGKRAIEEIFDLNAGWRIYATYQDGLKQGQFLYYDKAGTIVGVEAYEKGKLLKRKGKVYTVKEDGSFIVSTENSTVNVK
jgi:antitoxin component YwqK of YwqJK toxin-antitoxin module